VFAGRTIEFIPSTKWWVKYRLYIFSPIHHIW